MMLSKIGGLPMAATLGSNTSHFLWTWIDMVNLKIDWLLFSTILLPSILLGRLTASVANSRSHKFFLPPSRLPRTPATAGGNTDLGR